MSQQIDFNKLRNRLGSDMADRRAGHRTRVVDNHRYFRQLPSDAER